MRRNARRTRAASPAIRLTACNPREIRAAAHVAHAGQVQQLVELGRYPTQAEADPQATRMEGDSAQVVHRRQVWPCHPADIEIDHALNAHSALLFHADEAGGGN
jgi:hypothetical protein